VVERLKKAYSQLKVGDPLEKNTIYGPLHTKNSVKLFLNAIEEAKKQGGQILIGGKEMENREGNYVEPTIVTGLAHDAKIGLLKANLAMTLISYIFTFPIAFKFSMKLLRPYCTFSNVKIWMKQSNGTMKSHKDFQAACSLKIWVIYLNGSVQKALTAV